MARQRDYLRGGQNEKVVPSVIRSGISDFTGADGNGKSGYFLPATHSSPQRKALSRSLCPS